MPHNMLIDYCQLHYFHVSNIALLFHNTLVLSIYVDVVLTLSIIDNVKLPLSRNTKYNLINFTGTQGL